jgi:hypothetical protein
VAKGFLVSYAGYPYTPSSLMPDNGLASLAGSLLNAGHEVTILDYGTVEIIGRLMPASYKDRLKSIYDALANGEHDGLWNRLYRLYKFTQLKRLDNTLSAVHNREAAAMAGELSALVGNYSFHLFHQGSAVLSIARYSQTCRSHGSGNTNSRSATHS